MTIEGPQISNDVYSRITDKIISDLELGTLFWRKPWSAEHLGSQITRPLRWNDEPYSGINIFLLWAAAADNGYALPHWMTYNQAVQLRGQVCKGEKATQIVYANKIVREEKDDNGNDKTKTIPYLKTYSVFNVQQIAGLPACFYEQPLPRYEINPERRDAVIDAFFTETKADIYTGAKASYNQGTDRIQMPPFESFHSAKAFYGTLAHELTHWTKHPNRLNRDMGRTRFGDEGYAKEELVAELGACFLAADLGLEPMPQQEHAAYIQSWLKALQDDKRLIFNAASHAQRAVEYIHSITPNAIA